MFKLIRRNLLRNKRRTVLTVLSIAIALVLLSSLNLLLTAMSGVDSASANRLVVRNAISLTFTLPEAYGQRTRDAGACRGHYPHELVSGALYR